MKESKNYDVKVAENPFFRASSFNFWLVWNLQQMVKTVQWEHRDAFLVKQKTVCIIEMVGYDYIVKEAVGTHSKWTESKL